MKNIMKKFLLISILLAPQVVFGESEKDKCINDVQRQATLIFTGFKTKNDPFYSMASKYEKAAIDNESLLQKYRTEILQQQYNKELQDCEETIATEDIIKTNSCSNNYITHDTASCKQGQKLKECAEEFCKCYAKSQSDIHTPELYREALIKETCGDVDDSANTSSETQAQNASASDEQKAAKKDTKKQEKDQKKVTNDKINTSSNTAQPVAGGAPAVASTTSKTDDKDVKPITGSCTPDDPNAKSGRYDTDKNNRKICIIDSCKKYYKLSEDGKSCVLANAHSEQELKEKSEKVNELREKEQSLANRMISGVSMGAAGIGGMMLAESISEQHADKEAEQDMAAYLATFRCEYAGGKSVPGGTTNVPLDGDNLFELMQEYKKKVKTLTEMKAQLGLKPGIESEIEFYIEPSTGEVIFKTNDSALYDDTATGKTNGTYASVARALTDTNSADAQKWNDQKAQTDKNMKIGIGVGVGGAAVGLVGNILTNHVDWDKIKDKVNNSKENKDKIKMLKDGLTSAGLQNVDKLDFSKLDLTEFDVNSIDFTKIKSQLGTETDATKLLNTTNAESWKSSFSEIYPTE